jgi:hypothetical protein
VPHVVGVSVVEKADFTATGTPTRVLKPFRRLTADVYGNLAVLLAFCRWSPLIRLVPAIGGGLVPSSRQRRTMPSTCVYLIRCGALPKELY